MRARKIGRWVGGAAIAGVAFGAIAIFTPAAHADFQWDRAQTSNSGVVWVPATVDPSATASVDADG
jgi:hypothetical protein